MLITELQEDAKKKKLFWLASRFRIKHEKNDEWRENKSCFTGMCTTLSKMLAKHLTKNDFNAVPIFGDYFGAPDEYEPDDMPDDVLAGEENEDWNERIRVNAWPHWWVKVDDEWIVDISADQFHRGEEDEYRVVITNINDPDYGLHK